jgi:hypothetical protein
MMPLQDAVGRWAEPELAALDGMLLVVPHDPGSSLR